MKPWKSFAAAALASALFAAPGCGSSHKTLGEVKRGPVSAAAQDRHKQLVAEGDALFAQRNDEAKLRAAIAKWDEAIKLKSDDHETYAKLARATYLLADGFLAFDPAKEGEFLATHEQGVAYAEQGMRAISPDFERFRKSGMSMEDAVGVLKRNAVPLMYWYDVNLGKWAKTKGFATQLKHKDVIRRVMERIAAVDPDFWWAAVDRYWGAFYAIAPSIAGGDLDKSREHFEKAIARAPNYLATRVLYAEVYATKKDDRALFEKQLRYVLDAPIDVIPELAPEHEIEKKKAQKLLAEMNERF